MLDVRHGIAVHLGISLLDERLERGGDERRQLPDPQLLEVVLLRVAHLRQPQEEALVNFFEVLREQLRQLRGLLRGIGVDGEGSVWTRGRGGAAARA